MILVKISISLKLTSEHDSLGKSIDVYTQALNFISPLAFENEFFSSAELQKNYYYSLREKFPLLTAQMTCNVFRDVAGKYQTNLKQIKKKNKKIDKINKERKKKGLKLLKKKKLTLVKFGESHCYYNRNRDYTFDKKTLKITTVLGRKRVKFKLGQYQKDWLAKCLDWGAALLYRKRGNFYLGVSLEVPEKEIEQSGIMGIDLGVNKFATAYANGKYLVIKGGWIKEKKNKFYKQRQKLQSKGTKSAKRVLKRLSGKENRWQRDCNFCIVKQILKFALENNISEIGVENLQDFEIKKGHTKEQQDQNRTIKSWAYYDFTQKLVYKAALLGIRVVAVNPAFTSKRCPRCGHVCGENRPTQKCFCCQNCSYQKNADRIAADNIFLLTSIARVTGDTRVCCKDLQLVNHPRMDTNLLEVQAPSFREG